MMVRARWSVRCDRVPQSHGPVVAGGGEQGASVGQRDGGHGGHPVGVAGEGVADGGGGDGVPQSHGLVLIVLVLGAGIGRSRQRPCGKDETYREALAARTAEGAVATLIVTRQGLGTLCGCG